MRVGFELQVRSESDTEPDPSITREEFEDFIWQELTKEGFKPDGKDRGLLREVFLTATQWLVLITPRSDGFGFEVRSLQEFAAALWILEDARDRAAARVHAGIGSPHWRNTMLLAFEGLLTDKDASARMAVAQIPRHR